MGGGRAPCCDKSKVKRGPWSPAEDLRLITFIQKQGHDNWRALPKQAGLLRCGKSCRLRWINYLRPDVKRGNFTPKEEETIVTLHQSLGNKWSKIASFLPGRTDNEIKNVWNTHLKKRLASKVDDSHEEEPKESSITSSSSSSSSGSFKSYNNQNIGLGLGKDQPSRTSLTKRPRNEVCKMALLEEKQDSESTVISNQTNLTNEAKQPSSSSNSYESKITNSNQVDAVVVVPEEELMDSLFNFSGPYEDDDILQEANDQEIISDEVLELPLESDSDFWNMLDNLECIQSNEAQLHEEVEIGGQSSNFREECDREGESRKWLRHLENELGLEVTRDGGNQEYVTKDAADQQLVPETYHNETMLKQEINQGMSYFQMWPFSPQNFAM